MDRTAASMRLCGILFTLCLLPFQAHGSGFAFWQASTATLSQEAYVKQSVTSVNVTVSHASGFGLTVSLSNDTLVVGAYVEDSNATGVGGAENNRLATDSGAVYVFTRTGSVWTQQAYIKSSNSEANDQFGVSVALSGDTLAVGAQGEDSNATGVNGVQSNNLASGSGAVFVFTRSGSVWSQQAYIKSANSEANDGFGAAVGLSGDVLAVTAPYEDSNALGIGGDQSNNALANSGAIYVFARSGAVWSQQAYIKASNSIANNYFAQSLSVSGETLIVGAKYDDSNATGINGDQSNSLASNSGAVFVYTRSGSVWSQQAYIKASNTGAGDCFGSSVSIEGDTLAVGAVSESSNATGVGGDQNNDLAANSGAAYVFTRSGSVWTQQAYIKPSNTGANDGFGNSISLSGETLVIGATNEDSNATGVGGSGGNNSSSDSGAAYVFVRSGSVWSQQAYIKASNTGANDYFGYDVSISGDTIAVGAALEDSEASGVGGDQNNNLAIDSGAAYVFTRSGAVWSHQAYIKSSTTTHLEKQYTSSAFGFSVSLSANTLAVGATAEDSSVTGIGGDPNSSAATDSGAVYVFTRTGSVWSQQAYIKASNTGANDNFGYSVSLESDTLVVGSHLEDSNATGIGGDQSNNANSNAGAVYVFTRTGSVWSQQAYVKASNSAANDNFGNSVSVSGDTLAVAAYREDSDATGVGGDQANDLAINSGAVYIFTRTGAVWSQQAYIKASNTGATDFFGYSVSLSGETLAVGAHQEDSNATGIGGDQTNDLTNNAGAVYVFTRSGAAWSQQAYIKASNTGANDFFGYSVSLSGETLAVGAHQEDSNATGIGGDQTNNLSTNSGAVYIFTRTGSVWSQQAYLKASNTGASDLFGYSVSLSGNTLAVGAYQESSNASGIGGNQTNNLLSNSGAAYVFKRSGAVWSQHAYIKASNPGIDDNFGTSVSVSGSTLAVGATQEDSDGAGINGTQADDSHLNAGAVYVFKI